MKIRNNLKIESPTADFAMLSSITTNISPAIPVAFGSVMPPLLQLVKPINIAAMYNIFFMFFYLDAHPTGVPLFVYIYTGVIATLNTCLQLKTNPLGGFKTPNYSLRS